MEFNYFLGIDISKETLDITMLNGYQKVNYWKIDNSENSIRNWLKTLMKQYSINAINTLICMEHTGIYNALLLEHFALKKLSIWLETSLRIKKSSGMQRGKNDKIDSFLIAQYAYDNKHKARLWQAPREVIKQLKNLSVIRRRLINGLKQFQAAPKEQGTYSKKLERYSNQFCKNSLAAMKKDLKAINEQIRSIIEADNYLIQLFKQVCSVDGVGPIIATEMIICTNEFKNFDDPKQFACYAGVAPFEHSSGKTIRGKTRVSHMANKTMKMLLHMGALAAVSMKGELRDYFNRKVIAGKNKMNVINAVRNKIIHRIFACVNERRCYEKNYAKKLV
jgi:transposase